MRRLLVVVLVGLAVAASVRGQQIHRNPFESRQVMWRKGTADAPFQELLHEMTNQAWHTGQQSEHVQIQAEQGANVFYVYSIGRADLVEELGASVWIRANRPGVQLLARLVLPRERDPHNLDQPVTTLIRGDTYSRSGRWDRLELRGTIRLAQQQQQLMRAELKRDVNFEGAYLDQLMLNVYGGKGLTEVWIDDLEIGPVSGPIASPAAPTISAAPPADRRTPADPVRLQLPRESVIELNQDRLLVNRKPFFMRGIRYSDTPLAALRNAGFNTIWLDYHTPAEAFQEAVNLGFWLVPDLPVLEENPRLAVPTGLAREIARFGHNDAVLFWYLGGGLMAEQAETIGKAAQTIRAADPYQGRPVAGDMWDGFQPFSRHLDLVGVHRWPLMTSLELSQYRAWLEQRRHLARPGTYLWTWVQTQLPDWYTNLVYERPVTQGFEEPIGPQPEQIRLLTYVALAAGYHGVAYWSDRFLANSHWGRDRLLQMAILNQELEILEPMLATAGQPSWIKTKHPEVMAAVLRYEGGVLVLPLWLGKGSQFVPGQLATTNLEMVIPEAPRDAQVWEVSPGDVRPLRGERVAGGIRVVIPEFGLTTALVFTADVNVADGGLVGRLQQTVRKTQRLAAQWAYELASEELKKVEQVHFQLEEQNRGIPDGRRLLDNTRQRLSTCRETWARGTPLDYREAYAEAQRALRPLRILMRAHWENAVKLETLNRPPLDSPVASPYALSYFTLPRHWLFMEEINRSQPTGNLLADGGFESAVTQGANKWTPQEVNLTRNLELLAQQVAEQPKEGQRCLKLQIKPRDPTAAPMALERTFLALSSPALRLQPGALVQISGWVRIPEPIQASADGVLLFDSIGGEPLAVRLVEATPWRKFTLYRRVPASGTISVTAALAGIGTAYFDDLRIEPLYPASPTVLHATPPPIGSSR